MAMDLDERIEYRRYQLAALSALLAADRAEKAREDARRLIAARLDEDMA